MKPEATQDGDALSYRPLCVGITAAAGGQGALEHLVSGLPVDHPITYIIALRPGVAPPGILEDALRAKTNLPVVPLTIGETLTEAGRIYLAPVGTDIDLREGAICIKERHHTRIRRPCADTLFQSMARVHAANSVGIVLTGQGVDGSHGIHDIRDAGGATIAQDVATAEFPAMPAAAIETGCVDLTAPPNMIGKHLARLSKNTVADVTRTLSTGALVWHPELMQTLLRHTRIDFRDYDEATMLTRIARRMVALGIDKPEHYVTFCRSSEAELDTLHRDILISITRFFRDPDRFEHLGRQLADQLADSSKDQIRIWVAGCATGQEAYSIAILLAEQLGGLDQLEARKVQIIATDIDTRALDRARIGVYPLAAAQDIPQHLLEKYFITTETTVNVLPELRAAILFSKHNVLQDPPFINLDLVCLRNTLNQFNLALRERVLARAHYGLKSGGVLFLGTTDNLASLDPYFEPSDTSGGIFTKRGSPGLDAPTPSRAGTLLDMHIVAERHRTSARDIETQSRDADRFDALARAVAPNGCMVTRSLDIIRVLGDITPMLELKDHSSLRLSVQTLKHSLRSEAKNLILKSLKSKDALVGNWHQITGPGFDNTRMRVFPVITPSGDDLALLGFETRYGSVEILPDDTLGDRERTRYLLEIEHEVQSTREALQQAVEELQVSNEELQSVNVELQSVNEELQYTNEELEAANAELEKANKDLNAQSTETLRNASNIQIISTELDQFLEAADMTFLVLDTDLVIQRASGVALAMLDIDRLPPQGMHLSHCSFPPGYPSVMALAKTALGTGKRQVVQAGSNDPFDLIDIAPVQARDGTIAAVTVAIRDYSVLSRVPFTTATENN